MSPSQTAGKVTLNIFEKPKLQTMGSQITYGTTLTPKGLASVCVLTFILQDFTSF